MERFDTFTVLMAKISRRIRKIKTVEMAKFNLKSPHVSCLYYIYKYGAMTAKELCDLCDEDKASISRSLEYLEENGYLFCESISKKRYKAPLSLTELGQKTGALIVEKIDAVLRVASEGLSNENRINLYASLALIDDNLKKICDTYGENVNVD